MAVTSYQPGASVGVTATFATFASHDDGPTWRTDFASQASNLNVGVSEGDDRQPPFDASPLPVSSPPVNACVVPMTSGVVTASSWGCSAADGVGPSCASSTSLSTAGTGVRPPAISSSPPGSSVIVWK